MSAVGELLKVAAFERSSSSLFDDNARARTHEESEWVLQLANTQTGIYGLNTLTGHRDGEAFPQSVKNSQFRLIESHLVPSDAQYFGVYEARCVGVAKIFAVRNGGTGLSTPLVDHLLKAIDSPTFAPSIPKNQSYSSGDVIPAAHWAHALISWDGYIERMPLRPGEALGLINGSFVHLGIASSLVPRLLACGKILVYAFCALACLSDRGEADFGRIVFAEHTNALKDLETIKMAVRDYGGGRRTLATSPQASVSIRAIPEVIIAIREKIDKYTSEINYGLNSQSANPLFNYKGRAIESQASFLAPCLAIDQSALLDCLLLVGATLAGGIQFTLSGRAKGIPVDGGSQCDPFGFIQVPKEIIARLEQLRAACAHRPFGSIGNTSFGIEDLWTNGLIVSENLRAAIETIDYIALRVINVCEILSHVFRQKKIFNEIRRNEGSTLMQLLTEKENFLSGKIRRVAEADTKIF